MTNQQTETKSATGGAKSFDFGPFTQADWDWLLGEARKQDPEAVVFFHAVRGWLVTSSLDGTGMGRDRGDIRSRLCIRKSTTPRGWENGLGLARRERRIYPDDCPEASARWGAKPTCSHARIDERRMVCLDCGVDDMGRYTAEETDEQWLKMVVFELTGVTDFSVRVFANRSAQLVKTERFPVVFFSKEVSGRDVREIRMRLRDASWPLKDSPAGVGSNVGTGQTAEAASLPRATEPTPAEATRYCAECRAPMKARPGREVCRYCDLRCGGYSDPPPHEAMRRREESARQRMALMDESEKPRPSKWSWELERAHPWSNDDD